MYSNTRVTAFGRALVAFQSLVLMFTLVLSSSPLMAYAQTEGEAPVPVETTSTESSDTDTSDEGEEGDETPADTTPPAGDTTPADTGSGSSEEASKPAVVEEGAPAMTEDEIRAEEEAAEDDFLNQPEESEDLGVMMRGFFHIPKKPRFTSPRSSSSMARESIQRTTSQSRSRSTASFFRTSRSRFRLMQMEKSPLRSILRSTLVLGGTSTTL